jgi:hypothetical protein
MKFSAEIKIRGINPYIDVSRSRAQRLKAGWRKPMPVRVQINSQPEPPWRICMMPRGNGGFYLYLHGAVRTASGTRVGDRVQARVAFDTDYKGGPAHAMPGSFRSALSKSSAMKAAWNALSPSRKKEILRYFANLKSRDARERNIRRAVAVLSGSPERFMGRSWNEP